MKGSHYVKPTAQLDFHIFMYSFQSLDAFMREENKKIQNKNKDPKESLFASSYN